MNRKEIEKKRNENKEKKIEQYGVGKKNSMSKKNIEIKN